MKRKHAGLVSYEHAIIRENCWIPKILRSYIGFPQHVVFANLIFWYTLCVYAAIELVYIFFRLKAS